MRRLYAAQRTADLAKLVYQQQRAGCCSLQYVAQLHQVSGEHRIPAVICEHAHQDAICEAHSGMLRRHKAANVGQVHNDAHLLQVHALSRGVRPGDNRYAANACANAGAVGVEAVNQGRSERMPPCRAGCVMPMVCAGWAAQATEQC